MRQKLSPLGTRVRAALQLRWVRVALVLLAVLVAISAPVWAAQHIADSVTITVTHYEFVSYDTLGPKVTDYSATITDMTTARAVQSLLNHTGAGIQPASPAPGAGYYQYDFRFSFLGLPVEEVQIQGLAHLTILGIHSPFLHRGLAPDGWRQISQLTGMPDFRAMPIPQPSALPKPQG